MLPARVPTLLINGSAGIAVGIATRIPPHNLREVVAGLHALIDDPSMTSQQLMAHIPGPDFPTGARAAAWPSSPCLCCFHVLPGLASHHSCIGVHNSVRQMHAQQSRARADSFFSACMSLFCTGGEILASAGIREAYETGRGPVTVRGRAFIEGTPEASTSAPSSSQGVWPSP